MNSREIEIFMAERGLGYSADNLAKYAKANLFAAPTGGGQSCVMAQVSLPNSLVSTYHWGYYPKDEAMDVARRIKRLRKVHASVIVHHDSEWV